MSDSQTQIVRQISTFLANEPGVLTRVCATLAEQGINIKAISVLDTVDHAVVRFILDDPERGEQVLEEGHLFVFSNRVLEIPLPSRPGALAELSGKFAEAGINIEYAYGSTTSGGQGVLYLSAEDPEAAAELLAG